MAKAAEGMRAEIHSTFVAYVIMVFALALGLLMSFWILMDWMAGTISTVVLVYGIGMWWKYCSRIYNKFYLESLLKPYQSTGVLAGTWDTGNEDPMDAAQEDEDDGGVSMTQRPGTTIGTAATAAEVAGSNSAGVLLHSKAPTGSAPKHEFTSTVVSSSSAAMQGYIGKMLDNGRFVRQYAVVNSLGYMHCYVSRQAFVDNPNKPLHDRPINLRDHSVTIGQCSFALNVAAHDPPIKAWQFQTDSGEELHEWISAISTFAQGQHLE
jgi:hypothetical protein